MRYFSGAIVLAAVLMASAAFADSAQEVNIYRGGELSQEGIGIDSWGSGKASETKEKILTGSHSIKITTQGLYAGGRLDFSQPVTLYTDAPEKGRYLLFTLYFDDVQRIDPAAGTNNEVDADSYATPKANKVRFLFVTDKGVMTSVEEPTVPLDQDDNWVRIAVPLSKLKLAAGETEFKLSRLVVFADMSTTLYVGEIKLLTDNQPIRADISGSQVFGVNDRAFFLGTAEAGFSALKYSWDYDDSNGIQSESVGRVAPYTYTRGGDFTITLTVTDRDGIKAPVTVIYKVSVNE